MAKAELAITTIDNPYNPFDQFTKWFFYDEDKGYRTCERLARKAMISEAFTDAERDEEMERAMTEMVVNDPLQLYRIVNSDNFETRKAEMAAEYAVLAAKEGGTGGS